MDVLDIILYSLIGLVVIMIVIGLAITNYAGKNLVVIYNEYSKKDTNNCDALNFAKLVSDYEFDGKIQTEVIDGFLTDHYYKGKISLSESNAYSSNIAALAVSAHELGHAMQFRDTPKKMKSFSRKLVISDILSKVTVPLLLIGIVFVFFNIIVALVFFVSAIIIFLIGLFAKLSTIKIEKEASQNAIILLEKYAGCDEEYLKYAKKVLSAAKLTYVAAFLRSVLSWTLLVTKYDFY